MEYVLKALLHVLWRAIKAQNSQCVVTEYNNKHSVSVQWRKKEHETSTLRRNYKQLRNAEKRTPSDYSIPDAPSKMNV